MKRAHTQAPHRPHQATPPPLHRTWRAVHRRLLAWARQSLLGLAYGGFSYTKDTTAVKLGPIEMTVKEKKTVNVPMWAGIGAIVLGGVLLATGGKR